MTEEQYTWIVNSLNDLGAKINKIELLITRTETVLPEIKSLNPPGIISLAERLDLKPEDIYNLVHFEAAGKFQFLFNIPGKKESEKQLKATLSLLTVSTYYSGMNTILSKELVQKLTAMQIKSLDHISHNLKKKKQYLVFNGKSGDPNSSYTITKPGLDEGIKIIKQSCKNLGKD